MQKTKNSQNHQKEKQLSSGKKALKESNILNEELFEEKNHKKRGRKHKISKLADSDFIDNEKSTKVFESKLDEQNLKFSQIIENIANKSLRESTSDTNEYLCYESYLIQTCDADVPERTLMRLYGCEIQDLKEFVESLKGFVWYELLKNEILEDKEKESIANKISELINIVHEKNHDFPYVIKHCKHIYEPELNESNLWDISILCDLHRDFYIKKKTIFKKFLELKSKKTFSLEITSEIEQDLLPSIKTHREIDFLDNYLNFLNVCNEEILNNPPDKNTKNQNKQINDLIILMIKKAKDFIFVLDKFKKHCILPFKQISVNFDILKAKSKIYSNENSAEKNTKNNKKANKCSLQKPLFEAKSNFAEFENFNNFFNSFIYEIQKLTNKESNKDILKDNLLKFISLELLYYPPFKSQLFISLFEIAFVKFTPTKKGAYNLNYFNPFFKLRKSSAYKVTDLNEESFVAALDESERKRNIEIKYSFDNQDFELIKKNLIESFNNGSSDTEANAFRIKIVESIMDLAISKEYGELMDYFKQEMKDQAEKQLVKIASQNLAEILNLNCKKNLSLIKKNTNESIPLANPNPLNEELYPKTLSFIYSKQLKEIEFAVINQYSQVQFNCKMENVEIIVEEKVENIEYLLDEKTSEAISLVLKIQDPEIIVIGSEDAFAVHLKKKIEQIVKKMYLKKEIKHFSYTILLETKIQNTSIDSPLIQKLLENFPSENAKKAICLGRFVQNPLNEISLLWHFNPNSNKCLSLPIHPIIHLADKNLLHIYYQNELVKMTNRNGIEINKICLYPHLSGCLQFVSSLGYFKAEKIKAALNNTKNKAINCRDELNSSEILKGFPSVIKECKEFFLIKNSQVNCKINTKNPFEVLNLNSDYSELINYAMQYSTLFDKKATLQDNIKNILLNNIKAAQINIDLLLQNNFPDLSNEKSVSLISNDNKKYALMDIINELNYSNTIKGFEFKSIQLSDLLRNQCNYNLIHAKLVTAKIIKIDFEEDKIHCRLFNEFKATLSFSSILQGLTENFTSEILKKIKAGDLINARILNLKENENSFELFFPTKNFIEVFLKSTNDSSNVKHNFNPFWRFFDEETYYTGKNLKFPTISDGCYAYNDNRFYLTELISPLTSTFKNEKSLFDYLSKQTKHFLNVNFQTAKECLINFSYEKHLIFEDSKSSEMPFLFIPCERTPCKKLYVCLKLFNNKFWKIEINIINKAKKELDCENNFDIKYQIEEKVFLSLNEIVEEYLLKTINVLNAFNNHKKYFDFINKEHFKMLIEKKNKLSQVHEYNFTIFEYYPMHVILGYFIRSDFMLEFIKVTPAGFIYNNKEFSTPDKISTCFKENFSDYILNIEEKLSISSKLESKLKQLEEADNHETININSFINEPKNEKQIEDYKMPIDSRLEQTNSILVIESKKENDKKANLDTKPEEVENILFLGMKRERSSSPQKMKTREVIPEIINQSDKDSVFSLSGINEIKQQTENASEILSGQEIINENNFALNNQIPNECFSNQNNLENENANPIYQNKPLETVQANNIQSLDITPLNIDEWGNLIVKNQILIKDELISFTANDNKIEEKENMIIDEWGNEVKNNNNSNNNNNDNNMNNLNSHENNAWENDKNKNNANDIINNSNNYYQRRNNFKTDSREFNSERPYRGRGNRGRGFNGNSSEFRGKDRNNNFNRSSQDFNKDENRNHYNNNSSQRGRSRNNFSNRDYNNRDQTDRWRNANSNQDFNSCSGNSNQEKNDSFNNNNNNNENQFNSKPKNDWAFMDCENIANKQDLGWGADVNSPSNTTNEIDKNRTEWGNEQNNSSSQGNSNQNLEWGSDNISMSNTDKNDINNSNSNIDWKSNSNTSQFDKSTRNYSSNNSERPSRRGAERGSDNSSRPKGCFNCGEEGHFGRDCPKPKKERSESRPKNCFNCNEEGHFSRDCPNPRKERRQFNNNANESNSNTESNTTNRNFSRPKGCFNCGEEGHFGRDCTKPKKERSNNNDFKKPSGCFNCGDNGHLSRDCTQPRKNDNRRGRGNGNNRRGNDENFKSGNNYRSNFGNRSNNFDNTSSNNNDSNSSQNANSNDADWNFSSNNENANNNDAGWGAENINTNNHDNKSNTNSELDWNMIPSSNTDNNNSEWN